MPMVSAGLLCQSALSADRQSIRVTSITLLHFQGSLRNIIARLRRLSVASPLPFTCISMEQIPVHSCEPC